MKPPKDPSDLRPAFTWERLKVIAQLAYDRAWWVAKRAVKKDDRCGVGYRRWNLIKADLGEAAVTTYDWLSEPEAGAVYVFALGGVPCRFCKGDASAELPEKYAKPTLVEKAQFDLLEPLGDEWATNLLYRLLVVCDSGGRYPVGVYFVAADIDSGDILHVWNIPVVAARDIADDDGTSAAPIVAPKPPTILPPLTILARDEVEDEAQEMERERKAIEQARRHAAQRDKNKGA